MKILLLTILLMAGCTTIQDRVDRIEVGMTKGDVIEVLDRPNSYGDLGAGGHVMKYRRLNCGGSRSGDSCKVLVYLGKDDLVYKTTVTEPPMRYDYGYVPHNAFYHNYTH